MFKALIDKIKGADSIPADYSILYADMHSHLIPGIDDGSKSIEDSLELIRAFQSLGYKKLITTPHVMSDYYQNSTEVIFVGLEIVNDAMANAGIEMELEAAAEYYLDEGLIDKLENNQVLCFGCDKYLLFEISFMNPPDNMRDVVFKMQVQGYKPVLAHPERYPFWHQKLEEYERLIELGVLMQLNINSLSGYYGKGAKKIAEKMIDNNMVHFLGSDLHNSRHVHALQKTSSEKYLKKILNHDLLNKTL